VHNTPPDWRLQRKHAFNSSALFANMSKGVLKVASALYVKVQVVFWTQAEVKGYDENKVICRRTDDAGAMCELFAPNRV
jgi:hypothetical protein